MWGDLVEVFGGRANALFIFEVEMGHDQSGGVDVAQRAKEVIFDSPRVPFAAESWRGDVGLVRRRDIG